MGIWRVRLLTDYYEIQDTRTFSDAFQEGQNSHVMNSLSLDGNCVRIG